MKKTIMLIAIAFSLLSVSAHAANVSDTTAPQKKEVKAKDAATTAPAASQDVFVLNTQDLQYLESILSESNLIVNGKALSIKEGVSLLQWLESKKLQVPVAQEKEKKK